MVGSRVYVGGLPFGVRDRDLEKFFKGFGRIRDILIKNGYGFVEFEDYRDADDAVYELNGKELLGERVSVERARGVPRGADRRRGRDAPAPRAHAPHTNAPHATHRDADYNYRYGPPTRTEYRLIVENLSSRISWQDLKDYMRQAGEVTYADAHKQHRNEGVVEFATHSDMRAAIEKLDGTELNGRRIRLVEDRRSSRRRTRSSSSRSRSRSRDRRRSRSRSRSRRSSRSRSRSKSRPKTKSPVAKSRSRSRSKCVVTCAEQNLKTERSRSKSASASPARKSDRERSPRDSADRNGRERSREQSRSPSRERSRERSRSRSKSRSPRADKERSRSRSKEAQSPKREEERRASKSRSRSRSRSASRDRSRSRSRSRSHSASPRQNGTGQDRASNDRSPRSGD
ncbi:PREDICTED: serine-arginine protein 55 isoform X2 [Papilio xuthus]|uniref:Serine-arginine protein 55 isoform X2 n=1 Tax=Papilio xuthus TaxID=66420 RepID=A0AAJ6Z6E2_PAPXU|nr:PREDICTED: serine-arginine protein 55 isoform X2 [Papilio xuthus]